MAGNPRAAGADGGWTEKYVAAAEVSYHVRALRRCALTGGEYHARTFDRAVLTERRALRALRGWSSHTGGAQRNRVAQDQAA
jgi:hypothetical protein